MKGNLLLPQLEEMKQRWPSAAKKKKKKKNKIL